MNKKRVNTVSLGFPGIATLVVAFTILCVVVIAVLTLSKTISDRNLALASKNNFLAYSDAENAAQEKIAELREEQINGIYELNYPVTDSMELQIKVEINDSDYKIISHKTVYIAQWEGNEALNVWKP